MILLRRKYASSWRSICQSSVILSLLLAPLQVLLSSSSLQFANAQEQDDGGLVMIMTFDECVERLVESDRNNDGRVSQVEFANFLVHLNQEENENENENGNCPTLADISQYIPGGPYYSLLEEVSCFCTDYEDEAEINDDPACCDAVTPRISLNEEYPPAYLQRVCTAISEALPECTIGGAQASDSTTPPLSYTPFTDNMELQDAVTAYLAGEDLNESTYGPIEEWDVSLIEDFSKVFFEADIGNVNLSAWGM